MSFRARRRRRGIAAGAHAVTLAEYLILSTDVGARTPSGKQIKLHVPRPDTGRQLAELRWDLIGRHVADQPLQGGDLLASEDPAGLDGLTALGRLQQLLAELVRGEAADLLTLVRRESRGEDAPGPIVRRLDAVVGRWRMNDACGARRRVILVGFWLSSA
jgi:hypothetical protein